jgi:ABC-type Fe3+-hydroxamate transport system substrate-binding protein
MPAYKDQIGNQVNLKDKPKRVISLVPSQSEYLWDLGLREELVGITKFCIHPEEMFREIERVGGTKKLDLEKIRQLNPDLVIGNKEENERSQIELLRKEFPVWMSDIYTFEDAFEMMCSLGVILGKEKRAQLIVKKLKDSLLNVKEIFAWQRAAYFIWNDPYMLAAKNTFIDHVLYHIGLQNTLGRWQRYPVLDEEALKKINPEFCFLSSEPFPFKEKHVMELQKILPDSKIMIVDGEVFSWYGTRLLHLEQYVTELKKEIQNS